MNLQDSSLVLIVGVCTPHLFSLPDFTWWNDTKRQAYVLVSLLAKTINCHAWSIHESHTLLQCLFSTRRWWDLEQKQLSELKLADTTPLVICFTSFCKFWLDFFLCLILLWWFTSIYHDGQRKDLILTTIACDKALSEIPPYTYCFLPSLVSLDTNIDFSTV